MTDEQLLDALRKAGIFGIEDRNIGPYRRFADAISAAAAGGRKAKTPTGAQRRVLANLAAGYPAHWHCRTQSDHGGLQSTLLVLRRNGWISDGAITDAGRQLVNPIPGKQGDQQ